MKYYDKWYDKKVDALLKEIRDVNDNSLDLNLLSIGNLEDLERFAVGYELYEIASDIRDIITSKEREDKLNQIL